MQTLIYLLVVLESRVIANGILQEGHLFCHGFVRVNHHERQLLFRVEWQATNVQPVFTVQELEETHFLLQISLLESNFNRGYEISAYLNNGSIAITDRQVVIHHDTFQMFHDATLQVSATTSLNGRIDQTLPATTLLIIKSKRTTKYFSVLTSLPAIQWKKYSCGRRPVANRWTTKPPDRGVASYATKDGKVRPLNMRGGRAPSSSICPSRQDICIQLT